MMNPMMAVYALLLLIAAGSFVNTEDNDFNEDFDDDDFEGEFGRGRKGFSCLKMGSICFNATHFNVSEIVKEQGFCDNFVGGHEEYDLHHKHICPHRSPYCCVNCGTTEQHSLCHEKRKHGSKSRRECCPGELYFGNSRLGCKCCKRCKRRPQCRNRRGICVNAEDPVFNFTNCLAGFPNTEHQGEYMIKKRGCAGIGCHCCEPVQPTVIPDTTTLISNTT